MRRAQAVDLAEDAGTGVTVNRYTLTIDRLRAAALHPDESVQLIGQVASSLT
jgi:hypothetical protein